jgi:hypothetical protein
VVHTAGILCCLGARLTMGAVELLKPDERRARRPVALRAFSRGAIMRFVPGLPIYRHYRGV